jgi:hypothetical protein
LGRKKKARARAVPPVAGQKIFRGALRALLAAVVEAVSVEVTAAEAVILAVAGDRLQVAGSLAAVGLMLQVSATLPVNPPEGVTLMVEVFPVVAPGETVMLPLLVRAKADAEAGVTITVTGVVEVNEPLVPVTATV